MSSNDIIMSFRLPNIGIACHLSWLIKNAARSDVQQEIAVSAVQMPESFLNVCGWAQAPTTRAKAIKALATVIKADKRLLEQDREQGMVLLAISGALKVCAEPTQVPRSSSSVIVLSTNAVEI